MLPDITINLGTDSHWTVIWEAVGAVGSIAAAIFAVVAIVYSTRLSAADRKDRKNAEHAARDAEAAQLNFAEDVRQQEIQAHRRRLVEEVAVWTSGYFEDESMNTGYTRDNGVLKTEMTIVNYSRLPILNPLAGVQASGKVVLVPHGGEHHTPIDFSEDILHPGAKRVYRSDLFEADESVPLVFFRDVSGILWMRDSQGELSEFTGKVRLVQMDNSLEDGEAEAHNH